MFLFKVSPNEGWERMWSILPNNIKEIDGNILSSSNQFWGLSQAELSPCSPGQDAWWGSTAFCQKPAFHLSFYCKCFKRENLFKTFTTNSVKKQTKFTRIKYSTTNMRSSVSAQGEESCWSLDVDADNSPLSLLFFSFIFATLILGNLLFFSLFPSFLANPETVRESYRINVLLWTFICLGASWSYW